MIGKTHTHKKKKLCSRRIHEHPRITTPLLGYGWPQNALEHLATVHGNFGGAVAPRHLGVMPRVTPKSLSSRAIHYICCRSQPRSAINVCNARTQRRQVDRQRPRSIQDKPYSGNTYTWRPRWLGVMPRWVPKNIKPRSTLYTLPTEPQPDRKHV